MSASAVARNYAETLFELAGREGAEARYGELVDELAGLYEGEASFRRFLDAPSVSPKEKKEVLRSALGERAPKFFVRFLMVLVDRRRQRTLPGIAAAYRALLDDRAGRVRATVTLPFEAEAPARDEIVRALEEWLGKDVVPEFDADPNILGGVIIRVGDELLDASLRRQLERLRHELHRSGHR